MLPQVTLNRYVYKLFTLISYILRDARTYKHTNRQTDKNSKNGRNGFYWLSFNTLAIFFEFFLMYKNNFSTVLLYV